MQTHANSHAYRLGCCIPGASFMPEGKSSVGSDPLTIIRAGCTSILGAGFDYAEIGVGMIMQLSDADMAAAEAEAFPLEAANSFIPGTYRIVADGACAEGAPLYAYVDEAMARLSALGIKIVVFGSGASRRIPDELDIEAGRRYIVDFLRMCATLGKKHGVRVAIEPLRAAECNAINYTSTAIELVDTVRDPHIEYLADAFHMAHGGEPADTLTRVPRLPIHIHVSEPPDRTYPGSHGGEYLTAFARALRRTDYDARVSVECGFSDFPRELALAYDFVSKHF